MRIATIHSTRTISSSHNKTKRDETVPIVSSTNKRDSNTDTCCLGKNWTILRYTSRTADIYPYNNTYTPIQDFPIVSCATAYTNIYGITYILVINEALFYGEKLDHSLLNPNQLRHNHIGYWDNFYDKANPLNIEIPDTLTIPLHVNGTKISFTSRTPTNNELANYMHIELTNVAPWSPQLITLGQADTNQNDNDSYVQSNCTLTNESLMLHTI